MPLFSNTSNVILNNSQLTDITVHHSSGPTGIDVLFEASIPDAAHDSSTRDSQLRCFPGTRAQYVEDIINWALPPVGATPLPIYWMKGPAGVGKSAVAQTCAEKLKHQGKLGAAFFFSINRQSKHGKTLFGSKSEHYKFFTSIAFQLSTVYPNYRNLLDTKIRHDRSLVHKTMASQFHELIIGPLQELEEKGLGIGERIPVLVDGLDECEGRETQREIVEIVVAAARNGATPLCWAFFSRPEPHIEAIFSKSDISSLSHKTILPISHDADGDIELYLKAGFDDIIQRLNIIMDYPWPSNDDIKLLVRAAGGLFIYAKTVLRFVGQPESLNPDEPLQTIIAVISNRVQRGIITESPFAELDAFYILLMQRIPAKILPIVGRVLAFLSLCSNSSAIMAANVLRLTKVELEAVCNQLSAVVHFQRQQQPLELDPAVDTSQSFLQVNPRLLLDVPFITYDSLGGSISFYHKSFSDFLCSPLRSEIYCTNAMTQDVEERRYDLARQRENFLCWQGPDLVRAPGASDSTSTLSYPYTNELINSIIEVLVDYNPPGGMTVTADFDFRKQLYISTIFIETTPTGQGTSSITLHGCAGLFRFIHRMKLGWVQPGEFPRFNVANFKEYIKGQEERNILRPYSPFPPSLSKPQGRVESGLYTKGHGQSQFFGTG